MLPMVSLNNYYHYAAYALFGHVNIENKVLYRILYTLIKMDPSQDTENHEA